MIVLAIDTTTEYLGLALRCDGVLEGEMTWLSQKNHSVETMPAIEALLKRAGRSVSEIGGVGVALGPGSYNGLRVGLAIAKGIAYSLEIPLAGIASLEAMAAFYAVGDIQIAPLIRTARGEMAMALFKKKRTLEMTGEVRITRMEKIPARIKRKTLFCGQMDKDVVRFLASKLGSKAWFAPSGQRAYAAEVAKLAEEKFNKNRPDDLAGIEPLYMRQPHITYSKNKSLSRPGTGCKAVIWDMDGVIVNSAAYHLEAWRQTLEPLNISFTQDYFWQTFGIKNDEIVRGLAPDISPEEARSIIDKKEKLFRQLISGSIKPLPGARELISELSGQGIRMAVASSAPLENVRCILRALEIESCFEAVIGEEDVSTGKPSPEVFLKASERLNVEPVCCLVIEDSIPGIRAAKNAGMACLAVAGTNREEELGEADSVTSSLARVKPSDLLDLINKHRGEI